MFVLTFRRSSDLAGSAFFCVFITAQLTSPALVAWLTIGRFTRTWMRWTMLTCEVAALLSSGWLLSQTLLKPDAQDGIALMLLTVVQLVAVVLILIALSIAEALQRRSTGR